MPYSMRKLIVVFVLTIIIVLSSFGYWQYGNQAVNPQDKTNKIFVIEKGASIREIGNKLRKEGLLRDPVVFFLYIKLYGQDRKIQAGDYRLSPSMSLKEIVDALNHGTLDRWVTFPEGIRAHEIADLLKENIPSYRESWRERLNENEGYLFPDTYLVPKDADVEMVIAMMKNNFDKKINMVGSELNDPQLQKRVLIIASLIEMEAITDEEKPIISGIIDKRLKMGMALQVDATIQYAKGYNNLTKKWWSPILPSDYNGVDSSYNTYINPGLPPGPISNPGLEAIRAALNPASTPYLYYLHDSAGKIHLAKTMEEHNANIKKYLK